MYVETGRHLVLEALRRVPEICSEGCGAVRVLGAGLRS